MTQSKQIADKFQKGILAIQEEDFLEAFGIFQNLSEEGDAQSQLQLGILYYFGRGTETNFKKAAFFYRKSADKGNAEACRRIGQMYDMGKKPLKQNDKTALRFYKKAVKLGDENSKPKMATLYYHTEDIKNFKILLQECAKKKINQKILAKAKKLTKDKILKKTNVEIADAVFEAAIMGNKEFQHHMGMLYVSGKGVERNYEEALVWFSNASRGGQPESLYRIAQITHQGKGNSHGYRSLALSYAYAKTAVFFKNEKSKSLLEEIKQFINKTGDEIFRNWEIEKGERSFKDLKQEILRNTPENEGLYRIFGIFSR